DYDTGGRNTRGKQDDGYSSCGRGRGGLGWRRGASPDLSTRTCPLPVPTDGSPEIRAATPCTRQRRWNAPGRRGWNPVTSPSVIFDACALVPREHSVPSKGRKRNHRDACLHQKYFQQSMSLTRSHSCVSSQKSQPAHESSRREAENIPGWQAQTLPSN